MKDQNENGDLRLKEALNAWRVNEPLPPRFQERVWNRIEAAEAARAQSATPRIPDWLAILFARPAFAPACAALLLVAGLAIGFTHANTATARMDAHLAQRYVASVNPYSDPGH